MKSLLTSGMCDPLIALMARGEAPVDGVEVGGWFTPERIQAYRRDLAGVPFYFHGGNMISNVGLMPGAVQMVGAYIEASGSPWVSMHLTTWLPGLVYMVLRWKMRLPPPDPKRGTARLIRQVERLARAVAVPILLENIDSLPYPGLNDHEVHPELISSVLAKTGCGFLLDIGHVRVAAAALGMTVDEYLGRLPLERVVQVHVSGPRTRDGVLFDAHEPLQEVDYGLLERVLAKTHPKVVTLEYIREEKALKEQLARLREIVDAHNYKNEPGS